MNDFLDFLHQEKCKPLHPAMSELLQFIAENGLSDTFDRDALLRKYNIKRISGIKEHTVPVILDYIQYCLKDDKITEQEFDKIRLFECFLGMPMANYRDFERNGGEPCVREILKHQIDLIDADYEESAEETLHKEQLQGIFGMPYDRFENMVQKIRSARDCAK